MCSAWKTAAWSARSARVSVAPRRSGIGRRPDRAVVDVAAGERRQPEMEVDLDARRGSRRPRGSRRRRSPARRPSVRTPADRARRTRGAGPRSGTSRSTSDGRPRACSRIDRRLVGEALEHDGGDAVGRERADAFLGGLAEAPGCARRSPARSRRKVSASGGGRASAGQLPTAAATGDGAGRRRRCGRPTGSAGGARRSASAAMSATRRVRSVQFGSTCLRSREHALAAMVNAPNAVWWLHAGDSDAGSRGAACAAARRAQRRRRGCIASGRFILGEEVAAFERAVAAAARRRPRGRRLLRDGRAAWRMLMACGVGPGRRGGDDALLVLRDRRGDRRLGATAGVRRHRRRDDEPRSDAAAARDRAAHEGGTGRAPVRSRRARRRPRKRARQAGDSVARGRRAGHRRLARTRARAARRARSAAAARSRSFRRKNLGGFGDGGMVITDDADAGGAGQAAAQPRAPRASSRTRRSAATSASTSCRPRCCG